LTLIASELEATGADRGMLMFEATETAVLTRLTDPRTIALLREVGIDYIQGRYVGKRRPVEIPR
jgi:EAL domain-containing protein (putative c-di-GMP-specific phosphodiesterase class I)